MKIIKLQSHLFTEVKASTEVCIASAVVSAMALNDLLQILPWDCHLRLLIGIDLPTSPHVFEILLERNQPNVEARIFLRKPFFHPKIYLVKGPLNHQAVFIGSGNFTSAGLEDNIELFHKLSEETIYTEYQEWFDQYFSLGSKLTAEWLNEYEEIFYRRPDIKNENTTLIDQFKAKCVKRNIPTPNISSDFANKFFKLHHFAAFDGEKPSSKSPESNRERFEVKQKLEELHKLVYPQIQDKGWDLHPHSMIQHIVSSYQHGEFTGEKLSSLWLHYGRSQEELDRFKDLYGENQTSLYHMRLQVLIHLMDVSIWLRVGKNGGSVVDRENFKMNLRDEEFRQRFFHLLQELPENFYLSINGMRRLVSDFEDAEELYAFVNKDEIQNHYFYIGTQYERTVDELSEANIVNTIMVNFEKLLPLYFLIRTKIS